MRGKFADWLVDQLPQYSPSMRPAHYAREVAHIVGALTWPPLPSMRPAHYAREVDVLLWGRKLRTLILQ